MQDWISVGSVVLFAAIIWMWLNPKVDSTSKRKELQKQLKRKEEHAAKSDIGKVYSTLGLTSITATRGHSTWHITKQPDLNIVFPGIEKGFFSETVYVLVNGDGVASQWFQESTAQDNYRKGDYGIVAITVSPGTIITRNIKPDSVHEDDMFNIYLGLTLIAK